MFIRLHAALIIGILLTVLDQMDAAVIKALSVSFTDVSTAIALAQEGDTVVVPAGSASWTSTLTVTKGITLQGANVNAADNFTVILDNVSRGGTGQGAAIKILLNSTQSFRLTGITFRKGSITSPETGNGVVSAGTADGIKTPCQSFRIDHCHFDQLYAQNYLGIGGWIYGVVDHCIFDGRSDGSDQAVLVMHTAWGGKEFGDGSWADYPYYGTDKFIFIEDCTFNNPNPNNQTNMSPDCYGGGRYVFRHNIINNCNGGGDHGSESSGRLRSGRCSENYNNTLNNTHGGNSGGQIRGGGVLNHDNVINGLNPPVTFITDYREFWPFAVWGAGTGTSTSPSLAADGTSPWDSNDPQLYASGTHNGSSGAATLTNTTKNWTPNQWVGYSVKNTTQQVDIGGSYKGRYGSYIESNTATTITFHRDNTYGPAMNFNSGDGYEIRKVLRALDQGGAGKGDLLGGAPPVNTTAANTVAWPHQALEPIYFWNNTGTSGLTVTSSFPSVQQNRDYYNLGTGLPANSTPAGVSAKYVAAVNGVDYTGPYTYPHPLTSPLAPPSNLTIVN